MIWYCLAGLVVIVVAVVGGGIVLALSACRDDAPETQPEPHSKENDAW